MKYANYFFLSLSHPGLHVRTGAHNTTNFTILANDFPSGLFKVDGNHSTQELAEDYDDGQKEITNGRFFISRDMGTIYNVSVSNFIELSWSSNLLLSVHSRRKWIGLAIYTMQRVPFLSGARTFCATTSFNTPVLNDVVAQKDGVGEGWCLGEWVIYMMIINLSLPASAAW